MEVVKLPSVSSRLPPISQDARRFLAKVAFVNGAIVDVLIAQPPAMPGITAKDGDTEKRLQGLAAAALA